MLAAGQAQAVADLAREVAERYGRPQDIEWAIDHDGRLWLLQARPMTALPDPVSWTAPGPGLWMRNFRLGEWLPEAVTPLFAHLAAAGAGRRLPRRHARQRRGSGAVPVRAGQRLVLQRHPDPVTQTATLGCCGRGAAAVKIIYNALIRVSRDPAAADRAVLSDLYQQWREIHLPAYRRLVADARSEAPPRPRTGWSQLVDQLGREAGIYLWYLAIVGGSAWKMEACLTRFCRQHLARGAA